MLLLIPRISVVTHKSCPQRLCLYHTHSYAQQNRKNVHAQILYPCFNTYNAAHQQTSPAPIFTCTLSILCLGLMGGFSILWERFIPAKYLKPLMPFSLFLCLLPSLLFLSLRFLFFFPFLPLLFYHQHCYRWSKSFQSRLSVAGC